ncbi:DinB family protein [Paenibacillus soyae]|uniref:DinB family protein n=1 Tax=Paenibacillus soyae TaxID=2969249 RepID=A0A9X2MUY5_9BACL|nr:DinB family protein [Paenibacillus soyae]MCR2804102.1 DinB family protein [Paenibacillus soyae]
MKTLTRMMEHLYWANGRLAAAMKEQGADHPEALRLLRHVVMAERVWLTRLQGNDSSHLAIWNTSETLDELIGMLGRNERGYRSYMEGLSEERLDDIVDYRNQSGAPFRTSIRDIVTHVALHGQYHRGQINRILRAESLEPVGLDFILFARD